MTCLHGGGRAVRDGAVRDVRGDHEAQGFPHGQTSQQRIYGVRVVVLIWLMVLVVIDLILVVGVLFRGFVVVGLDVVMFVLYW